MPTVFDDNAGNFHRELVYLALSSPANLAILPMQDVLGFGNDCRMNTPGTTSGNWQWRLANKFLSEDIALWLREQMALFGRIPQPVPVQKNAAFTPQIPQPD